MGRTRTLDWDAIAKAYGESNSTISGIAEHFGCSVAAVTNVIKKLGLNKPEDTPTAEVVVAEAVVATEETPDAVETVVAEGAVAPVESPTETTVVAEPVVEAAPKKKATKPKKHKKKSKAKKLNKRLDWAKVAKAYIDPDRTLGQIAEQFKCSVTAVVYVANRMGLKSPRHQGRRKGELMNRDWSNAVKRFKAGDRVVDIAKSEKTSVAYVYHVFQYLKVKRQRSARLGPRNPAWKKAVQMFQNGKTPEEIAKSIKKSTTLVRVRLRNLGCKVPKILHVIDADKAQTMYQSGMTTIAIAKALKASPGGVCTTLKRHGVKLRPRGKPAQVQPA